jgi:hypothetical protein
VALDRVTEGQFTVDFVHVSAVDPGDDQGTSGFQFGHAPMGGPLGNPDAECHVPHPDLGVGGDLDEHLCMIAQKLHGVVAFSFFNTADMRADSSTAG